MVAWCSFLFRFAWAAFVVCLASALSIDDFHRLSFLEHYALTARCGVSLKGTNHQSSTFRISYGDKVRQGELPWAMLLVGEKNDTNGREVWTCTASLISRYHIVTAASCLDYDTTGITNLDVETSYHLFGGSPCAYNKVVSESEHKDCTNDEYKMARKLAVKSIIVPLSAVANLIDLAKGVQNKDRKHFDDIAVMELKEPISKEDPDFNPICVAGPMIDPPDAFVAYGFGATEKFAFDGTKNLELYKLAIPWRQLLPYDDCLDKIIRKKDECLRTIFMRQDAFSRRSACRGDAGGGLSGYIRTTHFLHGIIVRAFDFCENKERVEQGYRYSIQSIRVAFYNDFLCYYTGVCSVGYGYLDDDDYEKHPEPVAFLSNGVGKKTIGINGTVIPKRKPSRVW